MINSLTSPLHFNVSGFELVGFWKTLVVETRKYISLTLNNFYTPFFISLKLNYYLYRV